MSFLWMLKGRPPLARSRVRLPQTASTRWESILKPLPSERGVCLKRRTRHREVQQIGSGARHLALVGGCRSHRARWEGKHRRACTLAPISPRSRPVLSSTGERHTASLKTRSPSFGRTAASLDSEAGRPSQFSKNHRARRASRPTFLEARQPLRASRQTFRASRQPFEPLARPFESLIEPFEPLARLNEPLVEPFQPLVEPGEPSGGLSRVSSDLSSLSLESTSLSPDLSRLPLNLSSLSTESTRLSLNLVKGSK